MSRALIVALVVTLVGCYRSHRRPDEGDATIYDATISDSNASDANTRDATDNDAAPFDGGVRDSALVDGAIVDASYLDATDAAEPLVPYPPGAIAMYSGVDGSILVYAPDLSATSSPIAVLFDHGYAQGQRELAFGPTRELYVMGNNEIFVFASGATGHARPIRHIRGPRTTLDGPMAIAVDGHHELFVAQSPDSTGRNGILVFAPDADGNVAPARPIHFTGTTLVTPAALAFNANNELFVGNAHGGSVWVFEASAGHFTLPIRMIGNASEQSNVTGLDVDDAGELYVTNTSFPGAVFVYGIHAGETSQPRRTMRIAGPHYIVGAAVDRLGRVLATQLSEATPERGLAVLATQADGYVTPEFVLDGVGDGVTVAPE